MNHGAANQRLGHLADRNERQASLGLNPAEHAQRIFRSIDPRLGKDCRVQRRQAVLNLGRMAPVTLEGCLPQARGATFAKTERQPCPPAAIPASAVMSSPESWIKSPPIACRWRDTRPTSPVASLTPTMLVSSDSRFIVSTDMSTTLRGGML